MYTFVTEAVGYARSCVPFVVPSLSTAARDGWWLGPLKTTRLDICERTLVAQIVCFAV